MEWHDFLKTIKPGQKFKATFYGKQPTTRVVTKVGNGIIWFLEGSEPEPILFPEDMIEVVDKDTFALVSAGKHLAMYSRIQ